jgi:DNA-binding transcriptional ArsR family regulator
MTAAAPDSVGVIQDPGSAAAMLHPVRQSILEALREPGSATSLSRHLGLPRQRINYHLRELERHALVELVEERRRGNCTERMLRTKARYFVISPETVGALAADPDEIRDRFSSAWLTALISRTLHELGDLRQRADRAGKRLATFSLDTELRFKSPGQRAAFADELSAAIARLVEKYHDEDAEDGRSFRLVLGTYPHPQSKQKRKSKGGTA